MIANSLSYGMASEAAALLRLARQRAGLSQRALARLAGATQPEVARIESGRSQPTFETLLRFIHAAGLELDAFLQAAPALDPQILDDVPRILGLSPEDRLLEIANISRFQAAARRV